jgi:transposase
MYRPPGTWVCIKRSWVRAFAGDPEYAFPGQGQMKPEQPEIARLKRGVAKLKADETS